MVNSHHEVSITIDGKHHKSPNPTTGAALYVLGQVKPDYDLFLEIHGRGDDKLIPNDSSEITLKEGEHFFSIKKTLNPGIC